MTFLARQLVEAYEEVLSLGLNQCKLSRPMWRLFLCCLGGLSGIVKVCTFRTTACEAIGGLRVEALSGSLSCRRRSSRGKIGQLVEALFGESGI